VDEDLAELLALVDGCRRASAMVSPPGLGRRCVPCRT